jgi:hypothetical protein
VSSERSPGALAFTVTCFCSSSCESCLSLAKVGTSVLKRFALSSLYLTSRRKSPSTVSPLEEISLTLPLRTCSRKTGV